MGNFPLVRLLNTLFLAILAGIFVLLSPLQRFSLPKLPTEISVSLSSTHGQLTSAFPPVFDAFCSQFNRSVVSELYLNYTATHLLLDTYYSATHMRFPPVKYHFAIVTAPGSFKARRSIRATWKRMINSQPSCSSTLAFYVGRTSNQRTADWLQRELQQNPDDMVLIDFCDAYENLPLKTYNIMNFVHRNYRDAEWVIKIDDDMLPNIPGFVQCFPRVQEARVGVYGWITIDKVPKPGDKYMIPKQRYGKNYFPPFSHGPAYAVRASILPGLLEACRHMPIINLEDVWFTGLCAEKAGISRKNVSSFLSMRRTPHEFDAQPEKAIRNGFFFHKISSVTVRKVWATMNAQSCDSIDYSCDKFTERLIPQKSTTN
ncbi:beta-1,3-galactosyltransferase 5-like [Paramacrobiotus metropolitanus]|uniref:beta-1,3-galactosyltransferase 5-like n=1 Tax=Paramacrobiotus metropolitanus TaxID=2943436 RepID=UPI002445E97D|nr:beta-1,3-galactosyltransferase 5-like [Paramacrobiotus metropolitanus]